MKKKNSTPNLRLKSRFLDRLQTQSGRLRGLYAQRAALIEQLEYLNGKIAIEEERTYADFKYLDKYLKE